MLRHLFDPSRRSSRVVAGMGGTAALAATLGLVAVTVFAGLVASEVPDAFDVSGERASGADTWGETFELVGVATVIAAITGCVASATFALLHVACRGRPARRGAVVIVALVPTAAAAFVICGALFLNRGDARLAVDCDGFRFDRVAFASPDPGNWVYDARGLASCGSLNDMNRARVTQLLGPGTPLEDDLRAAELPQRGGFVVYFDRGRAFDGVYTPDVAR